MTLGQKLFEAFGTAGLVFIAAGAALDFLKPDDGALAVFGMMAMICFVAGVLSWVLLWLYWLLDDGWADE